MADALEEQGLTLRQVCLEAARGAVRTIGKRHVLELLVERGQEQELKLFPDRSGEPLARILKRPDGTLEYEGPPDPRGDVPWAAPTAFQTWTWLTSPVRKRARALITKDVKRAISAEPASGPLRNHPAPERRRAVTEAVNRAMDQLISGSVFPEGHAPTSRKTRGRAINGAVRQRLIGVETLRFVLMAHEYPAVHLQKFNYLVRNRGTLEPLLRTNRNVVQYYLKYIAFRYGETGNPSAETIIEHPGEVIRAVKEDLRLTPGQWKWFLRLNLRWPVISAEERRRNIALTAQAAIDLGTRDYDPLFLSRVVAPAVYYQRLGGLRPWQYGVPYRAWLHLARAFLRNGGDERSYGDLIRVEDTLRGRITRDEEWGGPTDWNGYLQRSHLWHEENLRLQRARATPDRNLSWESLLGETDSDGLRLTPLTTSRELREAGEALHNCLATYDHSCALGERQVFAIYQENDLIAAGELARRGGTGQWELRQVEEAKHRRPRTAVTRAMGKVVLAYRRADVSEQITSAVPVHSGPSV